MAQTDLDSTTFSYDNQSVLLPGPERIRVAHGTSGGKELLECSFDLPSKTVMHLFQRGLMLNTKGPCLGSISQNSINWLTYSQVEQTAIEVTNSLRKWGLQPGSAVVIYSLNRAEWDLTNVGCVYGRHVLVPLYDSLGVDGVQSVLLECEAQVAFCGDQSKAKPIVEAKKSGAQIRHVVFFEEADSETAQLLQAVGISSESFQSFLEKGREPDGTFTPVVSSVELEPPKEEDPVVIIYTSGTTGKPKGVVLTHKGWVASISACHYICTFGKQGRVLDTSSVAFSYLPSAHSLNLGVTYLMFTVGGSLVYYSRDISRLMDDLKVARPTVLPIVPRLLYRIHSKVFEMASKSTVRSKILHMALNDKIRRMESRTNKKNFLYEWVVFKKIQQNLGGNVKLVMTGSAPLSKEVMDFTRATFGCSVLECYGQSESYAGISATMPGDNQSGHVGPPLPTLRIKLVDVENMNYCAQNDEGEICYQGTHVMQKYYKNPQETSETIDEQGWIHSGDIGKWLPNGTLKIIDRKKNFFKLAQGEYISSEKVENVFITHHLIDNIYIYGDGLKSYLVAIVDFNETAVRKFLETKREEINTEKGNQATNVPPLDEASDLRSFLNKDEGSEYKREVLEELQSYGKSKNLNSLETIKNIYSSEIQFSIGNDMLTPTMKLKRHVISKHFSNAIESMYLQGPVVVVTAAKK